MSPPLGGILEIHDRIDKIGDDHILLPRTPDAAAHLKIFDEVVGQRGQSADGLQGVTAQCRRRAQAKFGDARDMGKNDAGHQIRIQGEEFDLFMPGIRVGRFVQGTDKSDFRVRQRGHNGFQVVGPQQNVTVADDQNVVARMFQAADQIVDLAVGAGPAVFDRNGYQLAAEFPLDFLQQRYGRIITSLNGKHHLICRIILEAGTAQVLTQVLLKAVHRF